MKTCTIKILIPGLIFGNMLITSCEEIWDHCVDGNGENATETRHLESFERIEVMGDFIVQIDTGRESLAVVETDENLLGLVETHVSGNKLIIKSHDNQCIKPSHPVTITVTSPTVREIILEGSGSIYCQGLRADELNMVLEGSGEMECNAIEASLVTIQLQGSGRISGSLHTGNLAAHLEGSGEIRMNGEALNSNLKITGSGQIKADQLFSEVCHAFISGSGNIAVWVSEVLDVTITGSGTVHYTGDPEVQTEITGSGKVIHQ